MLSEDPGETGADDREESEGPEDEHCEDSNLAVLPQAPGVQKKNRWFTAKEYAPSGCDNKLWRDMCKWRQMVYEDYFEYDDFLDIGDALVLSDQVLGCIIDLAHFRRIQSLQDILEQMSWTDQMGIAQEIVNIICITHPDIVSHPLFSHPPRVLAHSPSNVLPSAPLLQAVGSPGSCRPCASRDAALLVKLWGTILSTLVASIPLVLTAI
jgi:hypothetical protein